MGTWKPIEIKPNDQELVGKRCRYSIAGQGWLEIIILCVGKTHLFYRTNQESGSEDTFQINKYYLRVELYDPAPAREIVKMAQALCKDIISTGGETSWSFSKQLYSSELEARQNLLTFHVWPAPQPDAEGFYAIERDVKGE